MKILVSLVFAIVTVACLASDAEAWTCTARSANGSSGWASHPYSRSYAWRRALAECAIRTPRNFTCVITGCY